MGTVGTASLAHCPVCQSNWPPLPASIGLGEKRKKKKKKSKERKKKEIRAGKGTGSLIPFVLGNYLSVFFQSFNSPPFASSDGR